MLMPPDNRAVYLIREGESLLFSVDSLFGRKIFPVLICREFMCKTLKLMHDLMQKIDKPSKKTQIPCYFVIFPVLKELMATNEDNILDRRSIPPINSGEGGDSTEVGQPNRNIL